MPDDVRPDRRPRRAAPKGDGERSEPCPTTCRPIGRVGRPPGGLRLRALDDLQRLPRKRLNVAELGLRVALHALEPLAPEIFGRPAIVVRGLRLRDLRCLLE